MPPINCLAQEGMMFTEAHATYAQYYLSRYGLLGGWYPFRTDVSVWPDEPVIDADRMIIASLLKIQGYRTAIVGKWYLGFTNPLQQIDRIPSSLCWGGLTQV